jgi:hypothetical protein
MLPTLAMKQNHNNNAEQKKQKRHGCFNGLAGLCAYQLHCTVKQHKPGVSHVAPEHWTLEQAVAFRDRVWPRFIANRTGMTSAQADLVTDAVAELAARLAPMRPGEAWATDGRTWDVTPQLLRGLNASQAAFVRSLLGRLVATAQQSPPPPPYTPPPPPQMQQPFTLDARRDAGDPFAAAAVAIQSALAPAPAGSPFAFGAPRPPSEPATSAPDLIQLLKPLLPRSRRCSAKMLLCKRHSRRCAANLQPPMWWPAAAAPPQPSTRWLRCSSGRA